MSNKVWNADMFKAKNELRKLYKEKDPKTYKQGRILRKMLAPNGCFGNFDPKDYQEVAVGTSGFRD